MAKKLIAVFQMCLFMIATVHVHKAEAEFKECYNTCHKECADKGNGFTFCEMKCDTDCSVIEMVKGKVEAEEKKRTKKFKAKENAKAEKEAKEEPPTAEAVQKEWVKATVAEKEVNGESETKEYEKKGHREKVANFKPNN